MDYFHGNSYMYKLCKLTCPGSSLCGSHCLVHTVMTSSQYFLVWPSCSVSKRLIFVNSCDAGVDMKGYIFTIPCAYYSIFESSCTKKKCLLSLNRAPVQSHGNTQDVQVWGVKV